MGISYLKIKPEKAINIIDDCIVKGYQIKDNIRQEYYFDKKTAIKNIVKWRKLSDNWTNGTIDKLGTVFVSQKELYNFRDAEPPLGATSENIHYVSIVTRLKARIDKLNEYDAYIRNQFDVKMEVISGNKIVQTGKDSKVEIKN